MVLLQDLLNFYQWNSTHVDMKKYQQLMNEGLVYIKRHPQYPLFLLNYTPRTQYRQKWCKELIHARGLVFAEDGEILARPLSKFLIDMKLWIGRNLVNMKSMRKWMEV